MHFVAPPTVEAGKGKVCIGKIKLAAAKAVEGNWLGGVVVQHSGAGDDIARHKHTIIKGQRQGWVLCFGKGHRKGGVCTIGRGQAF